MKHVIVLLACILMWNTAISQGVSINSSGADPDTSAVLDVGSSSKGMLIPRLTTSGRNAIALPAQGLVIYNTDENCFNYYNGSSWLNLCGTSTVSSIPIVHVYTSNTTWAKPSNLKYVIVEMVGGGGGGGGAATNSTISSGGGGGGGAGYARKIISNSVLNSTESVVIGVGGSGGLVGADGGVGGISLFGGYCSATGGNYGEGTNSGGIPGSGGGGGIGMGGDINCKGQGGSAGNTGSGSGIIKQSGTGGSSVLGGGAESFSNDGNSVSGTNGGQYGGGGSGGYDHPSGSPTIGGAGASGVVIVTEYY